MSNASRTRTPQDTAGTQGNRAKALQSAITAIEKTFGKGAIMRLGDNHGMAVERIPTGSLGLDIALGGGLPVGRITEIYGPESSGKTTVALSVMLPAPSAPACNASLSMPSTRSIRVTRSSWASISVN